VADPCPTCQQPVPDDQAWLTPEDAALAGFLAAHLQLTREVLEATVAAARAAGPDAFTFAVQVVDHVSCIQTVVRSFAATKDPGARAQLRPVLLVHAQPYQEEPDFDRAWLTELLGED
jgi:hypothetical protein